MITFSIVGLASLAIFVQTAASTAFNYDAKNHLALYWGQNSAGSQGTLASYCSENDADIFVVSFLSVFGLESPQLNLANACTTTFPNSDLLSCPSVAKDIQTCQSQGKIVLLSLGGGAGYYGFQNDSEAENFATTLWNMFGGGSSSSIQRPFGSAIVDGFDFDIEASSPDATGYTILANSLRTLFKSGSKPYYLSSAPQCPYPDAYIGEALASASFDFAFVQFYNNYCSLTGGNFNFATWQQFAEQTSPNKKIKILVGLPGSPSAAGSGYVSSTSTLNSSLSSIANDANFGGVMLWDASQAYANQISGTSYAHEVRNILNSVTGLIANTLDARDLKKDLMDSTISVSAHSHASSAIPLVTASSSAIPFVNASSFSFSSVNASCSDAGIQPQSNYASRTRASTILTIMASCGLWSLFT